MAPETRSVDSLRNESAKAPRASNGDCYSGLVELAQSLRERRRSPVEVAAACLQRIERLNSQLNAFITVAAESATEAAKTADAEIKQGKWRGRLHGIPVAIKDFYDTSGIPTTAAFEAFRHRVPGADAAAVAKLKEAGAIIVGKTNMHSLGMGTTGLESAFGPVKNPWSPEFIAGGSSSGSAAAVASGMCWATLDTDAIGSCRLPAACCGVVGLKPTYALVDMSGILAGEQPPGEDIRWLSHAGITARNVEDAAVVLDALVERSHDERSASFVDALRHESELRIGVADNLAADGEVMKTFAQAVETIRSLGHTVVTIAAPLTDFSKGIRDIEADRRTIAEQPFEAIDLMVLPTGPKPTPSVHEACGNPLALSAEHTMFANYFGLPAVSVPCGFDARGLPLGLQIVGKPWGDNSVLRLAHQYQSASAFMNRRPLA